MCNIHACCEGLAARFLQSDTLNAAEHLRTLKHRECQNQASKPAKEMVSRLVCETACVLILSLALVSLNTATSQCDKFHSPISGQHWCCWGGCCTRIQGPEPQKHLEEYTKTYQNSISCRTPLYQKWIWAPPAIICGFDLQIRKIFKNRCLANWPRNPGIKFKAWKKSLAAWISGAASRKAFHNDPSRLDEFSRTVASQRLQEKTKDLHLPVYNSHQDDWFGWTSEKLAQLHRIWVWSRQRDWSVVKKHHQRCWRHDWSGGHSQTQG